MRSEAAPHLIVNGGPAEPLERIKLGGTEIRETLLQELLYENPGILPVSDFDESFGPIVSLGQEIMGIAMRLKELYPEIELQPDKNSVAAAMRAEDLLPNSDKVLEIYQLAADRARELDPNASAMEETNEDDDGE